MYTYKAIVIRVVDGDTVDFNVDLGFRTYMTLRFRLLDIDAPEKHRGQEGWQESKEHLEMLLDDDLVILQTQKDPDNFGRWLCTIYKNEVNINQQMIDDGFAVKYAKG